MRIAVLYASVLLLFLACSSCRRKPGRPATELCLYLSEAQIWECEDISGNTRKENPEMLVATTIAGYGQWEKYVDSKEAKVRELERELSQCRGK